MKLFFGYLYRYRYMLAVWVLFTAVSAAVFLLYGVPAEPVVYAFLLCAAVSSVILWAHFSAYRRRMLLYRDIAANLPLMTEVLPCRGEPEYEALREMILTLADMNRENLSRLNAARRKASSIIRYGCIRSKRRSPPCA